MYRDETRSLKQALSEICSMSSWAWIEQLGSIAELPSDSQAPVRTKGYNIYFSDPSWRDLEAIIGDCMSTRAVRYRNGVIRLRATDNSQESLRAFQETVRQIARLADGHKISIVDVRTSPPSPSLLIESMAIAPYQRERARRAPNFPKAAQRLRADGSR
jgi:hypothetical protein